MVSDVRASIAGLVVLCVSTEVVERDSFLQGSNKMLEAGAFRHYTGGTVRGARELPLLQCSLHFRLYRLCCHISCSGPRTPLTGERG